MENQQIRDSRYDLDGLDHPFVLKYAPQYLARGAEHLVYEIPDHPNIVAKAMVNSIKYNLAENKKYNRPPDSVTDEQKNIFSQHVKYHARRLNELREIFGKDHILNQKKFFLKIPITSAILQNIGIPDPRVSEVWSVVMIQERSKGIKNPSTLDFRFQYTEKMEQIMPEDYAKVTEHLVFGASKKRVSLEQFLDVQKGDSLEKLLDCAEDSELLRLQLQECIEKTIQYTQKTYRILELAGKGNLILFPREAGGWTYEIVDALYPVPHCSLTSVPFLCKKISRGEVLSKVESVDLLNLVNYTRTVNGIAEQMGSKSRISVGTRQMPPNLFQALARA